MLFRLFLTPKPEGYLEVTFPAVTEVPEVSLALWHRVAMSQQWEGHKEVTEHIRLLSPWRCYSTVLGVYSKLSIMYITFYNIYHTAKFVSLSLAHSAPHVWYILPWWCLYCWTIEVYSTTPNELGINKINAKRGGGYFVSTWNTFHFCVPIVFIFYWD